MNTVTDYKFPHSFKSYSVKLQVCKCCGFVSHVHTFVLKGHYKLPILVIKLQGIGIDSEAEIQIL